MTDVVVEVVRVVADNVPVDHNRNSDRLPLGD